MSNKLIGAIIGVAVAIIVISSVFMPVFSDFRETEVIRYNNSDLNYAEVSEGDHTISWESPNTTYFVDGVESTTPSNRPIVISDKFVLIWLESPSIQVFYTSESGSGRLVNLSSLECVFVDGVATISYTSGGNNGNMTYGVEWGFIRVDSGAYSFIDLPAKEFYFNSPDQIYSVAYATNGSSFVSFNGSNLYPGGSIKFDERPVINTTDLFVTERSSIVVTAPDGVDYAPTGIVVPAEITAYKEPNHAAVGILAAVPIVLIVAALLIVIRVFNSR